VRRLVVQAFATGVLAASLLAPGGAAAVLPEALTADLPALRLSGEGRMRWFGLLLYEAQLWVDGPQWRWEAPFALDIRYARGFDGARIAQVSSDEIRRLGLADGRKLMDWRAAMERAFPDVKPGEHIVGVYRPGVGVDFFHEGRATAAIRDPEFARAFFSIWLDPKTREPKLRAALLGRP
jgi:hypothetical protein